MDTQKINQQAWGLGVCLSLAEQWAKIEPFFGEIG